tara:strand:+ start:119 stop:457 length:339 start_codon:yes stop_codon:yes gene_type:complete
LTLLDGIKLQSFRQERALCDLYVVLKKRRRFDPLLESAFRSQERGVDIETLSAKETSVLKSSSGGKVLVADRIGRKFDRPASEVSSALLLLELKGYFAKRLDSSFEAVSTFR